MKTHKILALTLALALGLSLVSCGSKTDDGKWSIDDDSILRFNEALMFYPESFE